MKNRDDEIYDIFNRKKMKNRDDEIYEIFKKHSITLEETKLRVVFVMFADVEEPVTIVYHPAGFLKRGHIYKNTWKTKTKWMRFTYSRQVNFFLLKGTLASDPTKQNDETPLCINDLPFSIQKEIVQLIMKRPFALGVVRFFLKKHLDNFLWRSVYPSGRIGYHVRKGMEECSVDYPDF